MHDVYLYACRQGSTYGVWGSRRGGIRYGTVRYSISTAERHPSRRSSGGSNPASRHTTHARTHAAPTASTRPAVRRRRSRRHGLHAAWFGTASLTLPSITTPRTPRGPVHNHAIAATCASHRPGPHRRRGPRARPPEPEHHPLPAGEFIPPSRRNRTSKENGGPLRRAGPRAGPTVSRRRRWRRPWRLGRPAAPASAAPCDPRCDSRGSPSTCPATVSLRVRAGTAPVPTEGRQAARTS
jgi:hypothetical protein